MVHVTKERIIEVAEALNLPAHPSVGQLQRVADNLGITYGRISSLWESERIGSEINTKSSVEERMAVLKEKAKKARMTCQRCGQPLSKRAKYCPPCADIVRREHQKNYKRKAKVQEE